MLKVFYDDHDCDGFCSAWLLWQKFRDQAEYIGINCDTRLKNTKIFSGDSVIVVDFRLNEQEIETLLQLCAKVTIIDHHSTFPEKYKNHLSVIWREDESAAMLTWRYCNDRLDFVYSKIDDCPQVVRYVQDRDLWKFELQFSKQINARIGSYPFDFSVWNKFTRRNMITGGFVEEGFAILDNNEKIINRLLHDVIWIRIGSYKLPLVNSPILQSEIGHRLAQNFKIGGTFHQIEYNKIALSVRSDGSEDVGHMMSLIGGGGHRCAAGAIISLELFGEFHARYGVPVPKS